MELVVVLVAVVMFACLRAHHHHAASGGNHRNWTWLQQDQQVSRLSGDEQSGESMLPSLSSLRVKTPPNTLEQKVLSSVKLLLSCSRLPSR